jgi:hypothetical protein
MELQHWLMPIMNNKHPQELKNESTQHDTGESISFNLRSVVMLQSILSPARTSHQAQQEVKAPLTYNTIDVIDSDIKRMISVPFKESIAHAFR